MEKWILEADVYRLQRQLRECTYKEERPKLLGLLDRKQRLLEKLNQAPIGEV